MTMAFFTLVGCSSKEEEYVPYVPPSTTTIPSITTTTTPSGTTPSGGDLDGMSSATVITDEWEYGESSYNVFYKNSSEAELLLDSYPSSDYLVFQALSTPYNNDSEVPIDIIHQSVKESLADRYDAVRATFNLIGRDAYMAEIAASETPDQVRNYYSLGLDALPNSWYEGLTNSEIITIKSFLLDYYNINDLLVATHYSKIDGIDSLSRFVTALTEMDVYLQTQSQEYRDQMNDLADRVINNSASVSEIEYTTLLTPDLSVRELMDIKKSLEESVPGKIKSTQEDIIPKRIGYYATSKHYGMSIIESILAAGDQVDTTSYSNVIETQGVDKISSKSARLYLPKMNTDLYFVITIQELKYDADNIYTYLSVETASISAFSTDMAQDLHDNNVYELNQLLGISNEPEPSEPSEEGEEGDGTIDPEDLDGMTSATPEFYTIVTQDGTGNMIEVQVPHFPGSIVYLDYAAFDTNNTLGYGDRADRLLIQDNMPASMQQYLLGDANLSESVKNGDLSAIQAHMPDVIFANADYLHLYDQLSAIAPVVIIDVDHSYPYQSFLTNVARVSTIFAVQALSDEITKGYDARLRELSGHAQGKNAVVVSISEGQISAMGENSDCSIIFRDLGMVNMATTQALTPEQLVEMNPPFLYILDRDGTAGQVIAPASFAGKVIYLDTGSWTQLGSGLTGMGQMLTDLENGFGF